MRKIPIADLGALFLSAAHADTGDLKHPSERVDGYPKISPNGTQLAYHNQGDEEQTVVTVLNLESGKRKRFACSDYSN